MSTNSKTNEWNILKDQFDALVQKEGVRKDNVEQVLDDLIRARFGELIAWAAGHKAEGSTGAHIAAPIGQTCGHLGHSKRVLLRHQRYSKRYA